MPINQYTYYYFIGIGGIGMSALARYFQFKGKKVFGYDKTPTRLTEKLQAEGMIIDFTDDISMLPKDLDPQNTLVIYTPAIKELSILEYFKSNNFPLIKRSKGLAEVSANSHCIAVAGTHGKTTTSTLLAHLLYENHFPMMAFLGGISENYNTNFLYISDEYAVVEADEFDKSFLQLSPYFASISSVDADHLDIYGNAEEVEKTFKEFAQKIVPNGKLFLKKGILSNLPHINFAVEEPADYFAYNIQPKFPYSTFDLHTPKIEIPSFEIPIQGKHNIENATAALAMALELGVEQEGLKKALKSFKGIKRRFTTHQFSSGKVYIDDYAHHPTEIKAALDASNHLFPQAKKLVVFQPHLFSRTKDFAQDFANILSEAEQVLLLDIYPAREKPIEGITSEWLAGFIKSPISISSLENAIDSIFNHEFDVLITLGAGNIDTLSDPIIEKMQA